MYYQVHWFSLVLVVLCTTMFLLLTVKFFWCPCMAINVSVQYNGGLLPDIILLTQGNPFECPEEVLSLPSMIPPKRFDLFPPVWDAQKVY